MLPLMLMLIAAPLPQTALPAGSPAEPAAAPTVRVDADGVVRGVVQAQEAAQRACSRTGEFQPTRTAPVVVQRQYRGRPSTVTTRGPAPVLNDLMFRQGDPVSRTLLLERSLGQCSMPITYDLTGSGAALPSFPARAD